jgi:hypothetical protein
MRFVEFSINTQRQADDVMENSLHVQKKAENRERDKKKAYHMLVVNSNKVERPCDIRTLKFVDEFESDLAFV